MSKLNIKCMDTGGSISVFEEVVEPGIGPPRHTHRAQLEIFHVISGSIRFEIEGVQSVVDAGGVAVVPAGAVHAFRNDGAEPAAIHFEMLPSGKSEEAFERLITEEIDDPAAFFDQYEMDLVGPSLEAIP